MGETGSRLLRRNRQTWVCIVAVLFVGDFILYGYLPSHERLESLQQVRGRQSQTIRMAAAQSAELPALTRRLRQARQTVERYDACVPTDRALGTFLQQIAAIMTQHHLTDQVVVPGKELRAHDLTCIPVQITCKGTLTDMFDFFTGLQELDRLIRFDKVVFKNNPEFTGQVSMQTDAMIFHRSSGQQQASDSAGVRSGNGVDHGA